MKRIKHARFVRHSGHWSAHEGFLEVSAKVAAVSEGRTIIIFWDVPGKRTQTWSGIVSGASTFIEGNGPTTRDNGFVGRTACSKRISKRDAVDVAEYRRRRLNDVDDSWISVRRRETDRPAKCSGRKKR